MHATPCIEHGILVGVVCCARTDEFCHERRLAAQAARWHYDGLSAPADHARMNKQSAARRFRDVELQVSFERSQYRLRLAVTRQACMVAIQQIKAADMRYLAWPTNDQGVKPLDVE